MFDLFRYKELKEKNKVNLSYEDGKFYLNYKEYDSKTGELSREVNEEIIKKEVISIKKDMLNRLNSILEILKDMKNIESDNIEEINTGDSNE